MISRRTLLVCGLLFCQGCTAWDGLMLRSQSPEETPEPSKQTPLVGDRAVPFNMHPFVVENVGLVTGLKGTGSDPKPSPQRAALISEMQIRNVASPNAVLATKDTSLVLVRAVMRPGIQKGDTFDVEIRVPSQSETTSLRGGFLLETRLQELAALSDNQIHQGREYSVAEGAVLVDPAADAKKDKVASNRGRILGGGRALKSRPLALLVKPENRSVLTAASVQDAINKRFYTWNTGGAKDGVAAAKTDSYIELKIHRRYKDNAQRYMAVVRAIAIRETEVERNERMKRLERQLLDPVTASHAALQLEAIGKQGADILARGAKATDPEVRFYSAEALAYLDDTRAAEPLGRIARDEPAFRVYALTALSAMDDYDATDQLRQLLHAPSAETRYGAFRALWAMKPNDPAIRGENLGKQFSYHIVDTKASPMVHIARSRRAEIVLFGREQSFSGTFAVDAGNRIMVTSREPGRVVVSRFAPNEPEQKRFVSGKIDEVIRAIVDLGGTYPDVVQALQQAKACNALVSRVEMDAIPEAGRSYDRASQEGTAGDGKTASAASSPSPDLFQKSSDKAVGPSKIDPRGEASPDAASSDEPEKKEKKKKSFFAGMFGGGKDE